MTKTSKKTDDEKRDEVLGRMLKTPPKPHGQMSKKQLEGGWTQENHPPIIIKEIEFVDGQPRFSGTFIPDDA